MLTVDGMCRVVSGLGGRCRAGPISGRRLELQYAASLGGIAISNVRTGNIHEAAGALLEHSALTHPRRSTSSGRRGEQYPDAIGDRLVWLVPAAARVPDRYPHLEGLSRGGIGLRGRGLDESLRSVLGRVGLPAGELERHI